MRKFFVYYKQYYYCDGGEFYTTIIEVNSDERANEETFNKKLNGCGSSNKKVLSWSLIEE